jgi:hypothetical protein
VPSPAPKTSPLADLLLREERRERLAVSLEDLDRVLPNLRAKVAPLLVKDKARLVRAEDCAAVEFGCELLMAAAVIDLLRDHDRAAGDAPTRAWVFRKAWTRVSGTLPLTKMAGAQLRLNEEAFGEEPPPVALAALVPRKVVW